MSAHKPFIVAEMSCNHLGDFQRARKIIDAAAEAGADAIKFQIWKPDTMCIDPTQTTMWQGKEVNLMEMYRQAHTPWGWMHNLFFHARSLGLVPFGAAFDNESVDFLENLGVDRHKVASFELTDLPLIRYMASKGKPMILSTGMAREQEIKDAAIAAGWGRDSGLNLTVLKCTSEYPASVSEANLSTMAAWQDDCYSLFFNNPPAVGVSDHTLGDVVPIAAVALGATYVEKHLTLKRSDGGLDSGFSMEPHEFKVMAEKCRAAFEACYHGYGHGGALRRSLYVSDYVVNCDPVIFGQNVVTARPGLGLPCSTNLDGEVFTRAVKPGTPLTADMLSSFYSK